MGQNLKKQIEDRIKEKNCGANVQKNCIALTKNIADTKFQISKIKTTCVAKYKIFRMDTKWLQF